MGDVVDILHGEKIVDPYRWLENGDSAEVAAWVEGQNRYTRSLLDSLPGRGRIRQRLDELLSIGSVGVPRRRDSRIFYTRRSGRQNQPVVVMREGDEGSERVVLDPNELSATGLVALDWWYPSHTGQLLAYGTSAGGDELSPSASSTSMLALL